MSAFHQNCLLCSSENLKELPLYGRNYLVKCKNCGFVFSKKIPSEEEIIKCYESYNREDYLSPVTIKRYNELLDKFEKYRKFNKILDIGCGIGYFLEEAKKRNWNVYGTEFTDKAINICKAKGINVQKGELDPLNYKPESFDVITSFEVIEHIYTPVREVKNIYSLLRKGGIFYITTPNFNSISRYILKKDWNIIGYPEHLCYYTPKTILYLLKKNGFKKLHLKTTGISITRIKKSKKKSEQPLISPYSDDEKLRVKAEKNIILFTFVKATNWILSIFGIGDNIKVIMRK